MTQPLNNIVQLTVEVAPTPATPNTFNIGLIVGSSTHIATATRTKEYTSTSAMTTDGWAGTEPEYKAAQVYFAQSPAPTKVVIGRQDTTATPAETLTQAITACRTANSDWYAVYACGAADADITAIAGYIETATPVSTFFYDTSDSAVSSGTAGNVMATLQSNKDTRSWGIFSTSQYAGAGVMGEAMGLNTGLAGSSYTLAYKSLTSVTPEVLTSTQVSTILGYNGNVYTNYGNAYNLLVQGTMADGTPFDQKLNIDQISADIQTAVMNALTTGPKIPQTDGGVTMLVNAISSACNKAVQRGAVAPGVWNGGQVLGLQNGATLSNGYLVIADTLANQSQADRTARKSPNLYVCLKMAGAIEHVIIGVIVNQ